MSNKNIARLLLTRLCELHDLLTKKIINPPILAKVKGIYLRTKLLTALSMLP